MKKVPLPRPAIALGLAVLGGLAPSSCGGDPEKAGLRTYEAAVEGLMAQDDRVTAELTDLRSDLLTGHAREADQSTYGREQALPFYRRFRESATGLHPGAPRLLAAHKILLDYLEERTAYLEAFDAFLRVSDTDDRRALDALQAPLVQADEAFRGTLGTSPVGPEVGQAFLMADSFRSKVFAPFQRGQATVAQVEDALRKHMIPALERAAEASKGSLAAEGPAGAGARWAKASREYHQALLQALPRLEVLQKSGLATQSRWERSQELRGTFLAEFKAYRESLR
jgi:hypothetical protein